MCFSLPRVSSLKRAACGLFSEGRTLPRPQLPGGVSVFDLWGAAGWRGERWPALGPGGSCSPYSGGEGSPASCPHLLPGHLWAAGPLSFRVCLPSRMPLNKCPLPISAGRGSIGSLTEGPVNVNALGKGISNERGEVARSDPPR